MKIKSSKIKADKNNKNLQGQGGLPLTEHDAILNSIPDVIIRINLNEKIIWWNNKLEETVELAGKKLLNYNFSKLIIIRGKESLTSIINQTVESGNAEIDAFLETSDGKRLYHFKSTLILGEENNKKEILVVGRDINERDEMAASLIRSQIQLQNLIDTIPFLIFLTAPDNRYLLVNKKYCDFVGLLSEEIIGYRADEIHSKSIADYFSNKNQSILSSKKPRQYEGVLEVDNKNINLSIGKFPLFDEDNNIYAICGVAEDITSQFQLQRQLQQTQKMEAIGQLTGGIAHDFNNILASIMGYTSLVKRKIPKTEDETINGYLNQVIRSGERARDLVQQLLAFSRGDVGGFQILDPVPLAKEAIKMLSSLIPSSINLNLKVKENNVKHYINADPVQFNQGIMNLVINARDAMLDVSGDINVTIEYVTHIQERCDSCHTSFSGRYIQLTVKDTGVGIEKDIIERIFDPFFTTKGVGKGSGMGLSMLHGIVHGSGGHVVINSILNKGTVIKVYFPETKVVDKVSEINGSYNYSDLKKDMVNINLGKKVIVVDDEILITYYLDEMLTDEGFLVSTFNDPEEAFKYYKNNYAEIDVVITDQTMPGLTGIELAKKMRELKSNLPIVLCSGYSEIVDDKIVSEGGVDAFVEKPFNDKKLLKLLSNLLIKHNLVKSGNI